MAGFIAKARVGADYELAVRLHGEFKESQPYYDILNKIFTIKMEMTNLEIYLSNKDGHKDENEYWPLSEDLKELQAIIETSQESLDDIQYRLQMSTRESSKRIGDIDRQLKPYRYDRARMPTDLDKL